MINNFTYSTFFVLEVKGEDFLSNSWLSVVKLKFTNPQQWAEELKGEEK